MLDGQTGNDTLYARDGLIDTLFGGSGFDRARRDNSATARDLVDGVEAFVWWPAGGRAFSGWSTRTESRPTFSTPMHWRELRRTQLSPNSFATAATTALASPNNMSV